MGFAEGFQHGTELKLKREEAARQAQLAASQIEYHKASMDHLKSAQKITEAKAAMDAQNAPLQSIMELVSKFSPLLGGGMTMDPAAQSAISGMLPGQGGSVSPTTAPLSFQSQSPGGGGSAAGLALPGSAPAPSSQGAPAPSPSPQAQTMTPPDMAPTPTVGAAPSAPAAPQGKPSPSAPEGAAGGGFTIHLPGGGVIHLPGQAEKSEGARKEALATKTAEAEIRPMVTVTHPIPGTGLKVGDKLPKDEYDKLAAYTTAAAGAARTDARAATAKESKEQARLDKSFEFNSKQLEAARKPLTEQAERFGRLVETINQKTPQADALVAPELLTVMAGGSGSGLRMTEAEISRVVGGRSHLESLKAALNKWQTDPTQALSITDAQRQQVRGLIEVMRTRIGNKVQSINDAAEELIDAPDVESHRRVLSRVKNELSVVEGGGGSGGAASGKPTATPSKGGPAIGEHRMIQGRPAKWDGNGWMAVEQ